MDRFYAKGNKSDEAEKPTFANLLAVIYDIIKILEHDAVDQTQKNAQSLDVSHKILELQKKLEQSRAQVKKLSGIDYSKQEQLLQLSELHTQLLNKYEIIEKYRNNYTFPFDLSKF